MLLLCVDGHLGACLPRSGYYANHLMDMWPIKQTMMGRYGSEMVGIKTAIENYRKEYGRWPALPKNAEAGDSRLRTEGLLVHLILGRPNPENPREIRFFDSAPARYGKFGVIDKGEGDPTPEDLSIVDLWGERYYVILDTNNDGEISNPEAAADANWLAKHPQPALLNVSVAIFSSGPDRDPATWEDNITSWR